MLTIIVSILVYVVTTIVASALDPTEPGLFVRVVDVGSGHSAVIIFPDNSVVIYDAGNYRDNGATASEAIDELLPTAGTIELLVLSHSDADHIAATDDILERYHVKKVLRSGLERESATWIRVNEAIRSADQDGLTDDYNLEHRPFVVGETIEFGGATITMVHGWHKPPWWYFIRPNTSKFLNAGSIVLRIEYAGKSVLFTGDSVGRLDDDPPDALIASERRMVRNMDEVPIDSDVLIAAHHGADNGSASDFIAAVSPEFVVFPSGNHHEHPRLSTVERFLEAGLAEDNLFRTDLGSNEGGKEWRKGNTSGSDPKGDDDVDILISPSGVLTVAYRE